MATCSSILAWKIPWKEEPGGLQCMGLQRVGHDRAYTHTCRKRITSTGCQFFILPDIAKLPCNMVIPVYPSPNSKSFQLSTNFPMFIITGIFQNYFSYLMTIKLYILNFLQFVLYWLLVSLNILMFIWLLFKGQAYIFSCAFDKTHLKFCFPHVCP